jgi:hypothetical protein
MKSLMKVWMNGQGLHDIDPHIVVMDVQESEPKLTVSTTANVKSDGMHITNTARESLQVQVTIEAHEYSMERRARLLQKVQAWARDGSLTVGYRPGQRLECICTSLPALGSAWKWTSSIQMVFTAYVIPYWISDDMQWAHIDTPTRNGETAMRPVGTAKETPLSFWVRNEGSSAMETLVVQCPVSGTRFELNDLGLGPGETIDVGYDQLGYLYMRKNDGTSVMNKRTAASSDDLLLYQQEGNPIGTATDQPATFSFSARGRWL